MQNKPNFFFWKHGFPKGGEGGGGARPLGKIPKKSRFFFVGSVPKQRVIWSNSSESALSLHILSQPFKEMDAIYLSGMGAERKIVGKCQQSTSDSEAKLSETSQATDLPIVEFHKKVYLSSNWSGSWVWVFCVSQSFITVWNHWLVLFVETFTIICKPSPHHLHHIDQSQSHNAWDSNKFIKDGTQYNI